MASFLFLFVACGVDLPEGWEDASPVEGLTQAECGGDPYEAYTSTVDVESAEGGSAFDWSNAHFRCAQDVGGFYRMDGDTVEVLIQPVDMNPGEVARCDCLYDVSFEVPERATSWALWRRWDNLNEANDAELVAQSE